jgi:hypothetical protein
MFMGGAVALALSLLLAATAHAQLFRSYLAPTGSDANPCTLPSPCRLLPAALAAVADGGEIWMLDSANYNTGPVNVTKSVTILAVPGVVGSVLAMNGPAINIATAGVKVALRNLVIVPFPGGGGTNGILMTAGARLTVDKCLLANLPSDAIYVLGTAGVRITDTTIRDNGGSGIFLQGGTQATITRVTSSGNDRGIQVNGVISSSATTADVADSTLEGNFIGLAVVFGNANSLVRASIRDSRILRNFDGGVLAQSGGDPDPNTLLAASNNLVSNNGFGIVALLSGAKVWASGNTVSGNGIGLYNSQAIFESAGNNAVRNNGTNKTGTITVVSPLE